MLYVQFSLHKTLPSMPDHFENASSGPDVCIMYKVTGFEPITLLSRHKCSTNEIPGGSAGRHKAKEKLNSCAMAQQTLTQCVGADRNN